jgi:PAS domain S-box-containing protein
MSSQLDIPRLFDINYARPIESEEAAEKMIEETSKEGIICVKTDLGAKVTSVNKLFTNIFGYQPGDIVGKNCNFLQSYGDFRNQNANDLIRQGIRGIGCVQTELINYCKNGQELRITLQIRPIFRSGRCVGFLGLQQRSNYIFGEALPMMIDSVGRPFPMNQAFVPMSEALMNAGLVPRAPNGLPHDVGAITDGVVALSGKGDFQVGSSSLTNGIAPLNSDQEGQDDLSNWCDSFLPSPPTNSQGDSMDDLLYMTNQFADSSRNSPNNEGSFPSSPHEDMFIFGDGPRKQARLENMNNGVASTPNSTLMNEFAAQQLRESKNGRSSNFGNAASNETNRTVKLSAANSTNTIWPPQSGYFFPAR